MLPNKHKQQDNGSGEDGSVGILQTLVLCFYVICTKLTIGLTNSFTPTFCYNEVTFLLELAGMEEQASAMNNKILHISMVWVSME